MVLPWPTGQAGQAQAAAAGAAISSLRLLAAAYPSHQQQLVVDLQPLGACCVYSDLTHPFADQKTAVKTFVI